MLDHQLRTDVMLAWEYTHTPSRRPYAQSPTTAARWSTLNRFAQPNTQYHCEIVHSQALMVPVERCRQKIRPLCGTEKADALTTIRRSKIGHDNHVPKTHFLQHCVDDHWRIRVAEHTANEFFSYGLKKKKKSREIKTNPSDRIKLVV